MPTTQRPFITGGKICFQYWEINFNLSGTKMFLGINNASSAVLLSVAIRD